ncbi:hypothetical protein [Paenibacillus woosongensis]|uniref:hypothetical protein n=1 Tax=Paenibacillus woosongensis TaxID=307580 RepID=UPI003D3179F2
MQIHHSKDLAHWRPLTRPLSRVSQLDTFPPYRRALRVCPGIPAHHNGERSGLSAAKGRACRGC